MCGFLGSLGRPTHPAHPDGGIDIERALPWISRRGPDGHQAWRSADGRASLLHARLAIVDRDPRSDQPFLDVERRIAVAFAGEIYNFHQVRTELAKQHAFATESDTEVVLAAYAHDGIEGLGRLKGMYALAIVDEARRRVVLARDPIGKKPLYFARWNGQAYFGSSALPMVALHGASVGLDASLLGHYWEHGFVPPDRSLLPGMAPVAPGECLELDWESQLLKRHDCSPVPEVLYSGEPLGQVTTTISRLCHQAVQRRLENNNPTPTALLSGGIDSTVLVKHASALCANHHKSRHLKTLSLGALIPGTNDELYARYAAHRIGVRVTTLRLRAAGLVDSVVAALEHQDEPLGMPSYYFLHELVRASATHSRILLTGDGGDELFLGYRAPGEWVGTPEQRQTSKPTGTAEPLAAPWMGPWGRFVSSTVLVGHMLAKVDRASAEQGVEIRCPWLDWDLVRYVRSLPFEVVAGEGRTKHLLKTALDGWPRWFVERRKLGFAYNLRWLWLASRFAGLRQLVDEDACAAFEQQLPPSLRGSPEQWATRDIFRHFAAAWRLLAWSQFQKRLHRAEANPASL